MLVAHTQLRVIDIGPVRLDRMLQLSQGQSSGPEAQLLVCDAAGNAFVCELPAGTRRTVAPASYLSSGDNAPLWADLLRGVGAARDVQEDSSIQTLPLAACDVSQLQQTPRLMLFNRQGFAFVVSNNTWDTRAVWLPPRGKVAPSPPQVMDLATDGVERVLMWDGASQVRREGWRRLFGWAAPAKKAAASSHSVCFSASGTLQGRRFDKG